MALPTASDNAFASLLVTEGSAPSSPASGKQRFYLDSADHLPKLKNSAGTVNQLPGGEIDYVEFTSPVNITATTEATSNTVVTGSAVTYDGVTIVLIEYYCPRSRVPAGNNDLNYSLWDGSTDLGLLGLLEGPDAANELRVPSRLARRLTPSAASHTYSIRAYVNTGTGHADAGAGGIATIMPGFIRITRAK